MGLNNALSIASSGLNAVQYAMSVSSQNTANASTAGYIAEQPTVVASAGNGVGNGVLVAGTRLATNTQVQTALYAQNSLASYASTQNNTLSTIAALQGSTSAASGSSGTLSDLLGNIRSAVVSLSSNVTNSAAQSSVVSAAQNFSQSLNNIAQNIQQQRQNAQDSVVSTVKDINTNLTTIGSLSTQIMSLKSVGKDTADLENQRFTALNSLSGDMGITWKVSANGDMNISTTDGVALPTRATSSSGQIVVTDNFPLTTSDATISESSTYPASENGQAIPGIMLNGVDVTANLKGGTLGASIDLRDNTLPVMQAQCDSLAYSVASRFQAQGISLFTDSAGQIPAADQTSSPPSGSLGFAQTIRVSSQYQDAPSLLNAGTAVQNVLSQTFGSTVTGVPSTGLGVSGTLNLGYSGQQDLISLATALTANQASVAADASSRSSLAQSTQTNLQSQFSSASGVSIDKEMANIVSLQNAYSANAKIISAVQSMFSSLLSAVGN
ncbi:flagellar hook-associated protein FlgK [Neokomagataea thailandica NBRC 106555]|uniref:Flagellar hook-associated protein 1 n=2 Tax=Neokomagataea TaxID=1223423 RepID=A0A4Y6V3Z1_9PROT|nr:MULTISPECIES: flagellar hook-associated protein FlgK [Neokomagataea]QDH24663.1 flagellar hook-associated protein FlgK [Neokomagataea tanensis]GBR53903.1 flagellar hook-associated protein FlgK [Neokomagataea thailandica NBRC 106555]